MRKWRSISYPVRKWLSRQLTINIIITSLSSELRARYGKIKYGRHFTTNVTIYRHGSNLVSGCTVVAVGWYFADEQCYRSQMLCRLILVVPAWYWSTWIKFDWLNSYSRLFCVSKKCYFIALKRCYDWEGTSSSILKLCGKILECPQWWDHGGGCILFDSSYRVWTLIG